MIFIGAYEPDVAKTTAGVTDRVLNAMPIKGSSTIDWGPVQGPAAVAGAEALPAPQRGLVTVINSSNATYETFAGTAESIYKLGADGTWTEIGSGFNLPVGDFWSFVVFGKYLLATNITDGLLAYNMAVPAGVNPVAGAPKFRSIAVIFDTLMGFSSDGDALLARNSAINDFTVWKPKQNGADYQPYPGGDELLCGAELPGGIAVVFQRDRYSVLVRDPQLLYQKQEVSFEVGAIGHQSVVVAAGKAYFHSGDGFYATAGGPPEPLGAERVDRTFLANADQSALDQMQGAYYHQTKVVLWRYKTTSDADEGVFTGILGYDTQLDKFFPLSVATMGIFAYRSPGISIDDITESIDDIPRSLDSRFYFGGLRGFACLDADGKMATFDGDTLAATLETQVSATAQSQLIRSCVPAYIGSRDAFTIQVGATNFQGDAETWTTPQPVQPSGRAMLRARGKNIKFRMVSAAGADWSSVRGIDTVDTSMGGPR